MLTSKNKVCSHFYPAIRYKYPQKFQISQFTDYSLRFLTKNEISPRVFLEVLKYLIRHTESQSITGKL